MSTQLLAFSGSLRADSLNTQLAFLAADLAESKGAVVTRLKLQDLNLPMFDEDSEAATGLPAGVKQLKALMRAHDGFLIATPEYNGFMSGALKNAIDWASRPPDQPFNNKAVAVMGASPGKAGTARAQYHLRQVFVFLNGHLINKPEVMVGGAGQAFDQNGILLDDVAKDLIGQLLVALQDMSRRMDI